MQKSIEGFFERKNSTRCEVFGVVNHRKQRKSFSEFFLARVKLKRILSSRAKSPEKSENLKGKASPQIVQCGKNSFVKNSVDSHAINHRAAERIEKRKIARKNQRKPNSRG